MVEELLHRLAGLPPGLVYLVLGIGSATENVVPPVPADTFVLFGAFLSGMGATEAWLVFLVTWTANVGSAILVYGLARRYGEAAFGTGLGKWLLRPRQLDMISAFYLRWGPLAIFFSRFFPALRALVPVFAGVSRLSFFRMAIPLAGASALWYGTLTYFGATLGRNWEAVLGAFQDASSIFLWIGAPILVAVIVWWWRTRHHQE